MSSDDLPINREARFRSRDLLFFWKFVRPLWLVGLGSLLLTTLSTALSSLLPLSVKLLIDFIILKRPVRDIGTFLSLRHLGFLSDPLIQLASSLNLMGLSIIVVGLLIGIIGVFEKLTTLRFQQEITYNLQTSLFGHVLRFPLSIIKQKQVGYLMSRVSDDVSMMQYLFSSLVPQMATSILYALFGCLVLFTLDRMVGIALMLLLPAMLAINFLFARKLQAVSYSEMERHAEVSQEMHEVISGAEVLKAFTAEKKAVEKVSGKLRKLFSTRRSSALLESASGSLTQLVKLALMLELVVLCIHRIEAGAMTIGDFTTVMAYVVYLSGRLAGISSIVISFPPVFVSMGRLKEMFDTLPEYEDESEKKRGVRPAVFRGELEYTDVSFSYRPDKPLLESVSFRIEKGQTLIITGESGSGKTTLVNLLLKFHHPQAGTILLDGIDIREIDTVWLREQIGVVSQDVFLFNDTVENNIRYGKPGARREEVVEAARQAHIHEHIETLPQGYRTMVGERGVLFSLGQRQRISIARAFLKNPAILILDEPSSSLDMENEKKLGDSLAELTRNRTTLIISHRMNMVDGFGGSMLEL
ncbi:MAG: ABC transporter ATP-binding protein [Chlorobiaceae bacterium]|nr:ABC transporter ATP-binding protein [Chlorobiaceae bacterium]